MKGASILKKFIAGMIFATTIAPILDSAAAVIMTGLEAIKGKWTVKTFKAKKNATKLIKKLKKGTYKVQVRAFVQSGSKKAYSAWAKAKKVKVK